MSQQEVPFSSADHSWTFSAFMAEILCKMWLSSLSTSAENEPVFMLGGKAVDMTGET